MVYLHFLFDLFSTQKKRFFFKNVIHNFLPPASQLVSITDMMAIHNVGDRRRIRHVLPPSPSPYGCVDNDNYATARYRIVRQAYYSRCSHVVYSVSISYPSLWVKISFNVTYPPVRPYLWPYLRGAVVTFATRKPQNIASTQCGPTTGRQRYFQAGFRDK